MTDRPATPAEPRSGTRVEFIFDPTVFAAGVAWDPETVAARMRELAFLNSAATLRLRVTGGKGSAAAAGGAGKATRRRRRSSAAQSGDEDEGASSGSRNGKVAGGGAIDMSSIGKDGGVVKGAVDAEGWQVFHFEGGLQEYVQW